MIARAGLEASLAALAARRPVFHSEADFQLALAWTLRELRPDIEVRLEYPVPLEGSRGAIDIWLREGGGATAIELKYWTRDAHLLVDGEHFRLKDQGAQPLNRYDFWKDVERTEQLVRGGHAVGGYVLAITNARGYWNGGGGGTIDEKFRIHEGSEVHGDLEWSGEPALGTITGREAPIALRGGYTARWAHYSQPDIGPGGAFRCLLLDVGAGLEAGR